MRFPAWTITLHAVFVATPASLERPAARLRKFIGARRPLHAAQDTRRGGRAPSPRLTRRGHALRPARVRLIFAAGRATGCATGSRCMLVRRRAHCHGRRSNPRRSDTSPVRPATSHADSADISRHDLPAGRANMRSRASWIIADCERRSLAARSASSSSRSCGSRAQNAPLATSRFGRPGFRFLFVFISDNRKKRSGNCQ